MRSLKVNESIKISKSHKTRIFKTQFKHKSIFQFYSESESESETYLNLLLFGSENSLSES